MSFIKCFLGWGLSHKGLIWHGGVALSYTKRFKENEATRIGILFDGILGTLTYYKDGVCLGVAFRGLNEVLSLINIVAISNMYEFSFIGSRASVPNSMFYSCKN